MIVCNHMVVMLVTIDYGLCYMLDVPVVAKLIKEVVWIKLRMVFHGTKPFLPIFKLTVNDSRIPVHICRQDDMGLVVPFFLVCEWPDRHVWQSTPDVKGYDIAIKGL